MHRRSRETGSCDVRFTTERGLTQTEVKVPKFLLSVMPKCDTITLEILAGGGVGRTATVGALFAAGATGSGKPTATGLETEATDSGIVGVAVPPSASTIC